jgi:hypothetical protein
VTAPKGRVIVAAIPVVLVNLVAFSGQLAFLHEHLPWPLAGQVLMAVALESIAVYLAFHAHAAQLANDSALRLRLASYGFATVIGAMNYSHFAGPGWRPTFAAVAVGLMSASSPWLWAIHSRRVSRDALLASGLIEPHALRLGPTRWAWHPLRSARVMWLATWDGITEPKEAVTRWEEVRRPRAPVPAPAPHPDGATLAAPGAVPLTALPSPPEGALPRAPRRRTRKRTRSRTQSALVTALDAEREFMDELASGAVPSQRQIRARLHVGQTRAREIHGHLESVVSATTPT